MTVLPAPNKGTREIISTSPESMSHVVGVYWIAVIKGWGTTPVRDCQGPTVRLRNHPPCLGAASHQQRARRARPGSAAGLLSSPLGVWG